MEAADYPEDQAESFPAKQVYKLVKEKVGRSQDVWEFRIKTLEAENDFLKNSFKKQNEHFQTLEGSLREKLKEADQLKTGLLQLERENDRLKLENDVLCKNQSLLDKSNSDLKERAYNLEAQLGELRKQLKKSKKLSKSVEKFSAISHEKLEAEKSHLLESIERLKEKLKEVCSANSALQAEVKSLEASLQQKDKALLEASFDTKHAQKEAHDLAEQLRYASQELTAKSGIIKDLENICFEVKGILKKTKKKHKKQAALSEQAQRESIGKFQSHLTLLEAELRAKEEIIAKLSGDVKELQKVNEGLERKSKKLAAAKSDVCRLEKSVVDYDKLLSDKNKIINESRLSIDNLTKEASLLQSGMSNLKEENSLLRSLKSTLEAELGELSQKISEQRMQVQGLLLDADRLKEDKLALQLQSDHQVRGLEHKIELLLKENHSLRADIESLERKDLASQKNRHELEETIGKLESSKARKKQQTQCLEQQIDALKSRAAQLDFELMKYKSELLCATQSNEVNSRKMTVVSDIKGLITCYKNLSK